MFILGINAYHGGASPCLIKDGQLIAAVEEERFGRITYQAGVPVEPIRFVPKEAGRCEDRMYDQHFLVTGNVTMLEGDLINILTSELDVAKIREAGRWGEYGHDSTAN